MIEGFLGALVGVGVVWGLYELSITNLEGLPTYIEIDIGNDFMTRWGLIILGFGVLVGAVGSMLSLAVHRYIRA
jgi:hypothetical protein